MKNILFGVVALFLVGGGIFYFVGKGNKHKDIHYHAGFIVYVDGVKQDYTDDQYMYFDICSVEDTIREGKATKMETIHLHENVGDVAHIHEQGATWGLLLENIGVQLPPDKPITGYQNGEEVADVPGILKQSIAPFDSVIIVAGEKKGIDLNKYVSKERIQKVEANSNYCGK